METETDGILAYMKERGEMAQSEAPKVSDYEEFLPNSLRKRSLLSIFPWQKVLVPDLRMRWKRQRRLIMLWLLIPDNCQAVWDLSFCMPYLVLPAEWEQGILCRNLRLIKTDSDKFYCKRDGISDAGRKNFGKGS